MSIEFIMQIVLEEKKWLKQLIAQNVIEKLKLVNSYYITKDLMDVYHQDMNQEVLCVISVQQNYNLG